MPNKLLVVSTGVGRVGLTSVSLGLVRALQRERVRVGFAKPIAQPPRGYQGPERSTALAEMVTEVCCPQPISLDHAEKRIADGEEDILMEEVFHLFETSRCDADVIIMEGLVPTDHVYATRINYAMARALNAPVLIVGRVKGEPPEEVAEIVEIAAKSYANALGEEGVVGVLLNKVPTLLNPYARSVEGIVAETHGRPIDQNYAVPFKERLARHRIRCFGLVPDSPVLGAPRVKEVADAMKAQILRGGDLNRRVRGVAVAAVPVPNAVQRAMKPGNLVIFPGDRADNLVAACMVSVSGVRLAALVLTGGMEPPEHVMELCEPVFEAGLTLLITERDTFEAAALALAMDVEVPIDDRERAELVMSTVANALDTETLMEVLEAKREEQVSPPAFRHQLIERARRARKRIVLPEGDEPRTITAAAICAQRDIAQCVLLGDPESIRVQAKKIGVALDERKVEILDPKDEVDRYVASLVELRKGKGVHPASARDMLTDRVWLGTMMLKMGFVDGLVSGAVHTTANTIRPALQVIKMAPGYGLVSSIFFMLLPSGVLVYGDCAVNPDPSAEDLADIAIQSAESAQAFGIPPRVAMISYSTGASGSGTDVEKVVKATEMVRRKRPDLLVDGPLQYDAAFVESVGRKKAPGSEVAGRATVFVFPDLNTGNTTYKAVQRSAKAVAIGPMLQGLAKPVNDLSRGALVEDIVFTIALTAIQATQVHPAGQAVLERA